MTVTADENSAEADERRERLSRITPERVNKRKRKEQIMASEPGTAVSGRRPSGSFQAGHGGRAFRAVTAGIATAAVAGLLAACGSAGAAGTAGVTPQAAASPGTVVSVRTLPGIGAVLADRSGKTLYSPQQEANGKILCTGSCLSFWFPVQVTAGVALRAPSGVTGVLGTIHRADDGLTQLTINGRPLYTFRLDQAPGQAHGNNYTDHFGSVSFTWHAITTSGTPAVPGQSETPAGGYSPASGAPGY
jgi:predicted lipoprotein with Yx(FWY)xxD motif